jgi:hypothetical protein
MPVVKPFRTDGENYLRKTTTDGDAAKQSVIQSYEKQSGSDGASSNTTFTLTYPYATGSNTLMVFVNGQKAELVASATDTTEYEETGINTVTFGASLLDSDVVEFTVVGNYQLQDGDIYYSKSSDALRKNLVINGDFKIRQRQDETGLGTGDSDVYFWDRWSFQENGSLTGSVVFRDTAVAPPSGFGQCVEVEVSTPDVAMAAGDTARFETRFEGQDLQHLKWGDADAQDVTVSFWVRHDNDTQTFCAYLQHMDGAASDFWIHEFTIAATSTWQQVTFTVPGHTAGDAAFDNDNAHSLSLGIVLAAGSTYAAATGSAWQSSGFATSNQSNFLEDGANTLQFTGFQIEVGSDATPFEHRTYGDQLQECMRYYERIAWYNANDTAVGSGHCLTTSQGAVVWDFKVTKRGVPAPAYDGTPGNFRLQNGTGGDDLTGMSFLYQSPFSVYVVCDDSTAGLTANSGCTLRINTDGGWIEADAEL